METGRRERSLGLAPLRTEAYSKVSSYLVLGSLKWLKAGGRNPGLVCERKVEEEQVLGEGAENLSYVGFVCGSLLAYDLLFWAAFSAFPNFRWP